MKIIFCDNDIVQVNAFREEFGELLSDHDLRVCTSPQFVFDEIEKGNRPDVVLMDIDLDSDKNGMDYADMLYEIAPEIKVIFVTAYTEKFVQDVFFRHANIAAFLTKPIQKDYLLNALNKPNSTDSKNKLHFQQRGVIVSLDESEIMYLESNKHYVCINTDDREVHTVQGKLSDYEGVLSDLFIKCHKSFVVNMEKIRKIDSEGIHMKYNKLIPISRPYSNDTRNRFLKYLEKK